MNIKIDLKKNLGIKIASFVFAVFLWFLVSSSEYITTSVYAPIDIDHLRKGYIATTNEQMISLVLKGSSLVLKNIDSKSVKVEIDVSSFKLGRNIYKIKERDIKTPPGVEILNYQPQTVEVTIDKLIEKDLKVTPNVTGKIKNGFYLKDIKLKPDNVKVKGALSILNEMSYVETIPINISEFTEDTNIDIPIKLKEGIKEVNPKYVTASIDIDEEIIEREYKNVPIEIINETSYSVKNFIPDTVRIRLRGRSDILNDNSINSLIKVYIKINNIEKSETYIRNIQYKLLNNNVKVVYIIPEVARVEVE
jgi:YbbR domain-containing protein